MRTLLTKKWVKVLVIVLLVIGGLTVIKHVLSSTLITTIFSALLAPLGLLGL